MALLFFDGFEGGDVASNLRGVSHGTHEQWSSYDSGNSFGPSTSGTPRTGARHLYNLGGTATLVTRSLTTSGGGVIGFAFKVNASPTTNNILCSIREGTTVHLSVEADASDRLQVKRGTNGTVLATGTTVLATNNYYYFELKFTIHDSTGSIEVKLDDATEIAAVGSLDTQNGGTGVWDRVCLACLVNSTFFDDFYVCDQSGSAPYNTFLGPVKIELLLAQSGNGSNTGLTTSTGSDHGALVDDTAFAPNSDTDYNEGASAGVKDTYNMANMTLTGNVLAVQPWLYARKGDVGVRTVCPVIRHSGTDYDGTAVAPVTSYKHLGQIYTQNPGTSAAFASVAEVNALEVGMKVVT